MRILRYLNSLLGLSRLTVYSITHHEVSPVLQTRPVLQTQAIQAETSSESPEHIQIACTRGVKVYALTVETGHQGISCPHKNKNPQDLIWVHKTLNLSTPGVPLVGWTIFIACSGWLEWIPRYVRLFKISKQINLITYWIELPTNHCISPSFHVSLMKPVHPTFGPETTDPEHPPRLEINEAPVWSMRSWTPDDEGARCSTCCTGKSTDWRRDRG